MALQVTPSRTGRARRQAQRFASTHGCKPAAPTNPCPMRLENASEIGTVRGFLVFPPARLDNLGVGGLQLHALDVLGQRLQVWSRPTLPEGVRKMRSCCRCVLCAHLVCQLRAGTVAKDHPVAPRGRLRAPRLVQAVPTHNAARVALPQDPSMRITATVALAPKWSGGRERQPVAPRLARSTCNAAASPRPRHGTACMSGLQPQNLDDVRQAYMTEPSIALANHSMGRATSGIGSQGENQSEGPCRSPSGASHAQHLVDLGSARKSVATQRPHPRACSGRPFSSFSSLCARRALTETQR